MDDTTRETAAALAADIGDAIGAIVRDAELAGDLLDAVELEPLRAGRFTIEAAKRIAGTLGAPSKLPGFSYGLSAKLCKTGGKLRDVPGTICAECYAFGDFYAWSPVRTAHRRRQAGITHPQWVDAMVVLIAHNCDPAGDLFRWHDSGDLQGSWHLARIVEVCRRTPHVRHWLPTREYDMVATYLRGGGEIPPNLVIRLSAFYVDAPPQEVPSELSHLPTSTAHVHGNPLPVSGKGSIACRAEERGMRCASCTACWDPRVRTVSYPMHAPRNAATLVSVDRLVRRAAR